MVANRIAKPAGLAQSAPWIGQAYWGGRGKCILLEVEKLDNYVVTVVITDFPGKIWMREREREGERERCFWVEVEPIEQL